MLGNLVLNALCHLYGNCIIGDEVSGDIMKLFVCSVVNMGDVWSVSLTHICIGSVVSDGCMYGGLEFKTVERWLFSACCDISICMCTVTVRFIWGWVCMSTGYGSVRWDNFLFLLGACG